MDTMHPMLADSIPPPSLTQYTDEKLFAWQQKVDGQRVLVHVNDGEVMPIARDGKFKQTNWAAAFSFEFSKLEGSWIFDGEITGHRLWLFDLPSAPGITPASPFRKRLAALRKVLKAWKPSSIRLLPTATTLESKVGLARKLYTVGGEGIMVKRLSGTYEPGRRSAHMLKAKFVNDIDCIATELGREGKSNIVCSVYDDGKLREIGEVTALAGDGLRVRVGDVICVRYLYATTNLKGNPRLYQPTYPKLRTDKAPEECDIAQLRYANKEIVNV